jgi:hypothetical protein
MPKVTLTYQLPEEREEFELAVNGAKASVKLEDIWNEVFRPHLKHGYSNPELQRLAESKNGRRMMELLIELYNQVTVD